MSDGPFYFAWVAEGAVFGPEHLVEDLKIFEFAYTHNEGEFARLTLTVANPRVGLLNDPAKLWCLFAWDDGATAGPAPLFHGRILGLPNDMNGPRVQLEFEARPSDYDAQKLALAATLKELPYWDPLWFRPEDRENPDAVLQARTARYHVDPVTLEVSVSDTISGEDGTLVYGGDDVLYGSVRPSISGPALSRVRVKAEVRFTQKAVGQVDISRQAAIAAQVAGSDWPDMITTYTPDTLLQSWPLPGDKIGAGWSWVDANLSDGLNRWVSPEKQNATAYTAYGTSFSASDPGFTLDGSMFGQTLAADFSLGVFKPTLIAGYDVARGYTEHVTFDLVADVQAVKSDPGEADAKELTFASNDASEPIDDGGAIPLGDLRQRSYLLTDRGHRSLEWLIARARAELLDGARVVDVPFDVRFAEVLRLSTRKNATIEDPSLPGGQASGKIVGFSARGSGSTGVFRCSIAAGVCVGTGSAVSAAPGEPVYVDDDYVDADYQAHTDAHVLVAGDVTYTDYATVVPNDDGLNFFDNSPENWLISIVLNNGVDAQKNAMEAAGTPIPNLDDTFEGEGGNVLFNSIEDATKTMEENASELCIDLKNATGGPFDTDFPITLSRLSVPKGIDLAAEAT